MNTRNTLNIGNTISMLTASVVSCCTITSCSLIRDLRNPNDERFNQANNFGKSKVSEAEKAAAKEKLDQAATISSPTNDAGALNTGTHQSGEVNGNPRNLATLPKLPKATGLIDPKVDEIPTNKELEEVEVPSPIVPLPSITIPSQ